MWFLQINSSNHIYSDPLILLIMSLVSSLNMSNKTSDNMTLRSIHRFWLNSLPICRNAAAGCFRNMTSILHSTHHLNIAQTSLSFGLNTPFNSNATKSLTKIHNTSEWLQPISTGLCLHNCITCSYKIPQPPFTAHHWLEWLTDWQEHNLAPSLASQQWGLAGLRGSQLRVGTLACYNTFN